MTERSPRMGIGSPQISDADLQYIEWAAELLRLDHQASDRGSYPARALTYLDRILERHEARRIPTGDPCLQQHDPSPNQEKDTSDSSPSHSPSPHSQLPPKPSQSESP